MDILPADKVPADTYILHISVPQNDGTQGHVKLKWDRDKKELDIICENVTLSEGAKKFFEYLKKFTKDWIEEELR